MEGNESKVAATVPIQSLTPDTIPPVDRSIRAIVSLYWPYSSSSKQCALLLADPDFRLRNHRGQVRVRFTLASATAVAQGKVGIGDEVILDLRGARWESADSSVRTPGRSVDGELVYRGELSLRVLKKAGQIEDHEQYISANESTPPPEDEPNSTIQTPAPATRVAGLRSSQGGVELYPVYSSPAFIRRSRLSGEGLGQSRTTAFDPFAEAEKELENEQDKPRKRQRITDVRTWRIMARSPSPDKQVEAVVGGLNATQSARGDAADMAPPPLPKLQMPEDPFHTALQEAGSDHAPSTPKLGPVPSYNLPLPSPFPVETQHSPLHSGGTQFLRSMPSEPDGQPVQRSPIRTQQSNEREREKSASVASRHDIESDDSAELEINPTIAALAAQSQEPQLGRHVVTQTGQDDSDRDSESGFDLTAYTQMPQDSGSAQTPDTQIKDDDYQNDHDLSRPTGIYADGGPLLDPSQPGYNPAHPQYLSDTEEDEELQELYERETRKRKAEALAEAGVKQRDFATEQRPRRVVQHVDDDGDDDNDDGDDNEEYEGDELADNHFHAHEDEADEVIDDMGEKPENSSEGEDEDEDEQKAQSQTRNSGAWRLHATVVMPDAVSGEVAPENTAEDQQPATPPTEQQQTKEQPPPATPARYGFGFGFNGAASVSPPTSKPAPQSAKERVMAKTYGSLFGFRVSPSPEKERHQETAAIVTPIAFDDLAKEKPGGETETLQESKVLDSNNQTSAERGNHTLPVSQIPEVLAKSFEMPTVKDVKQSELKVAHADSRESYDIEHEDHSSERAIAEEQMEIARWPKVSAVQVSDPPTYVPPAINKSHQSQIEVVALDSSDDERSEERASPPTQPQEQAFATQSIPDPANVTHEERMRPDAQHETFLEAQMQAGGVQTLQSPTWEEHAHGSNAALSDLSATSHTFVDRNGDFSMPPNASDVSRFAREPENDQAHESSSFLMQDQQRSTPFERSAMDRERSQEGPKASAQSEMIEILWSWPIAEVGDRAGMTPDNQAVEQLHDKSTDNAENSGTSATLHVKEFDENNLEPSSVHDSSAVKETTFTRQGLEQTKRLTRAKVHKLASQPAIKDIAPITPAESQTHLLEARIDASSPLVAEETQHRLGFQTSETHIESTILPNIAALPTPETTNEGLDVIVDRPDSHEETNPRRTHRRTESLVDKKTPVRRSSRNLRSQSQANEESFEDRASESTTNDSTTTPELRRASLVSSQERALLSPTKKQTPTRRSPRKAQANTEVAKEIIEFEGNIQLARERKTASHTSHHKSRSVSQPLDEMKRQAGESDGDFGPPLKKSLRSQKALPEIPLPTEKELPEEPTEGEATLVASGVQDQLGRTPGRKSFNSRLVPDVISAWFSPRRSTRQHREEKMAAVGIQDISENADASVYHVKEKKTRRTSRQHKDEKQLEDNDQEGNEKVNMLRRTESGGITTSKGYYTPLSNLEEKLNPSSQPGVDNSIDILAVVTVFTKAPERAKGGQRDYFTIFRVTDPSITGANGSNDSILVEIFRPWHAALPTAQTGDVVLLRGFNVKSRKRQPVLLSGDASAWCVWKFAEAAGDKGKPGSEVLSPRGQRRGSAANEGVKEEVKGPQVERGDGEQVRARQLRAWWIEQGKD